MQSVFPIGPFITPGFVISEFLVWLVSQLAGFSFQDIFPPARAPRIIFPDFL